MFKSRNRLTLPDYLRPGLDLVFVGFNPGERSARLGHYYAGIGNLFWKGLSESGLVPARGGLKRSPESGSRWMVPQPLTYLDDHRLPEFGIGLTDLAKRPSRSAADLSPREFHQGRVALIAKLERVRPRMVAFNGKGVYERLTGRPCRLGLQRQGRLCGARVFVLPSTSARNASVSRREKMAWFGRLRRAFDRTRHL